MNVKAELFDVCENTVARRGCLLVADPRRPGAAERAVDAAFVNSVATLEQRVAAPPHPGWITDIADAAVWLAGRALARLDPTAKLISDAEALAGAALDFPQGVAWSDLPRDGSLPPGTPQAVADTKEWLTRVRLTLPAISEGGPMRIGALRALIRLCLEYAVCDRTGDEELVAA